jgi:hypothetical protein
MKKTKEIENSAKPPDEKAGCHGRGVGVGRCLHRVFLPGALFFIKNFVNIA